MINPIRKYREIKDMLASIMASVSYIELFKFRDIKREVKTIHRLVLLSICIDVLAVVLLLILR